MAVREGDSKWWQGRGRETDPGLQELEKPLWILAVRHDHRVCTSTAGVTKSHMLIRTHARTHARTHSYTHTHTHARPPLPVLR